MILLFMILFIYLFLKEIILLFRKNAFNRSKDTVKKFLMLQNISISISNKCRSFELPSHQTILKKVSQFPQKYCGNCFNIANNKKKNLEQQISILK